MQVHGETYFFKIEILKSKILKPQAGPKKVTRNELESSKHPLNLVRISFRPETFPKYDAHLSQESVPLEFVFYF
jgi:hypothetical protein